jgi:cytoskeleton protein RodZ
LTEATATEVAVTGVGQELAAAREARGLALADIAQQLKFAARQLEALEQERFEVLPGGTFARGMVRSYARLLKLDPEPLVERIAGRFAAPDANRLAARYHQPVPFSDSARRSTFVYLGLSVGVLVLVGAVAYEWHRERTAAAIAPSVAKAPAAAKAQATAKAPRETKRPALPIQAQTAAAPATEEKPTVAAAPLRPGAHRLVVRSDEEAWIEIKDSADRLLVSSLNPAGTERVVQGGRPPYTLVIGNASQVRVSYNDRPIDLQPYTRAEVARLTLP